MKKYILILSLVVIGQATFAQQQAAFTNFLLNNYYYNPAIAGSRNVHVMNISYRNQWAGFDGAPKTLMGNFYGSVKNKGISGYGVSIISDKTGLTQRTGIYGNYAHHIHLNKKLKLGLGIQPGYVQYRVTLYDVRMADQGDDVLTGNVLGLNAFDVNAGFNLYHEKFFVMGSVNQLLGKSITFTTYNPSLAMHFTFIAGYNWQANKKFMLQPMVMTKQTKPVPAQIDVMLKGTYDKKYWAGLTYRTADAASLCIGYDFKERLTLGYGYDYSISKINKYQSGTHEIVLSFVLTKNKPTLDQKDEELNNSIMDDMKKKNHKEELEK